MRHSSPARPSEPTEGWFAMSRLVVKRTFRHYPPLVLVFLVGYFTYRLVAEPDWLVWSSLAVAALGILLNLLVIAVNGGQMFAAIDPSSLRMVILIKRSKRQHGSDF